MLGRRLALSSVLALLAVTCCFAFRPDRASAAGGLTVLAHVAVRQDTTLDCESAAFSTALSTRGYSVSQDWLNANVPNDTRPPVIVNGRIVQWGDPYEAFVGSYNGSETAATGYGIYYPPLVSAVARLGIAVSGNVGWDARTLYADVAAGHGALVWAFNPIDAGRVGTWTAYDGRTIPYGLTEHAYAMVGVDFGASRVLLANPWTGGDQWVAMATFEGSWAAFQNMAILVGAGATVGMAATGDAGGYWIAGSNGSVGHFGDAVDAGSLSGRPLNQPVVGIAATYDSRGYWLVARDGGIFPFGDAGGHGSTGGVRLNQPIVGMAATPTGGGYWLVASDGGVFPFGDAGGYGSTGGVRLNRPVVGMASTPTGRGYWLVASDGGIFPFGDAGGYGSTGGIRLNQPIVGMAATATGGGYWLVASDGGIFPFGDAGGYGSTGGIRLNQPIVGMAAAAHGYWLVAADGGLFPFGDAGGYGSLA